MPLSNLSVYSNQDVVSHYVGVSNLLAPERELFGRYVEPGMDILDIGVGGGRTALYLSRGARRYLGIDYAPAMVAACRRRFPDLTFMHADASNLAQIGDGEFDLVVFSFNGIDYLPDDATRIRALIEMRRVVRQDGHIIISSHSARQLVVLPQLAGANLLRIGWRLLRSVCRSFIKLVSTLPKAYFWRGFGYMQDPVHGGLYTHVSCAESIAADCSAAGLEIIEQVGAFHPRRVPEWANNWTTYVLRRRFS